MDRSNNVLNARFKALAILTTFLAVLIGTVYVFAAEPYQALCVDHTETYRDGVLISTCDIEDSVIVKRNTRGEIITTQIPSEEILRQIESVNCFEAKEAARQVISTPRVTQDLSELLLRVDALETIVKGQC